MDGSTIMADDMRSAQNIALLDTSFLYGGNAVFIEQQQAKWAANPASVDPSWAAFFSGIGDSAAQAEQAANGPSWKRADWPKSETSELVSSLDGNWALIEPKIEKKIAAAAPATATEGDVLRATRDSIKALMMIRAFRIRGHLAAKVSPDDFARRDGAGGWIIPLGAERRIVGGA